MDNQELGAVSALLADFSTRMNDLEENMRLLKERMAVVSQTILRQNDRLNKELTLIKDDISGLRDEIDRLKEAVEHIISESAELARKEELKVLERSMKMFEPLKYATEDDVKRIVSKMVKSKRGEIIEVEE
ncbi:MAG: hypothetical protein ACPLXC_00760 [Candidatus Pacearchaeota archaeon]